MTALAPTLTLRNGAEIPVLGLGTAPIVGSESVRQVSAALEAGYRLIDTAENYRNEVTVGQAIRDSGIDRSEIFITTKFNRRWHGIEQAPAERYKDHAHYNMSLRLIYYR